MHCLQRHNILLTYSSNLKLALTKTPSSLSPLTRFLLDKGYSRAKRSLDGEKQAFLNIELHFVEAGPISDSLKLVLSLH